MTLVSLRCLAGASIPSEAMMHFSPCFRVPPISEKFLRLHRKFSQFYLFQKTFPIFSSAKISDDLLFVIDHKVVISPSIFALSVHFLPISEKSSFPYFGKFPN